MKVNTLLSIIGCLFCLTSVFAQQSTEDETLYNSPSVITKGKRLQSPADYKAFSTMSVGLEIGTLGAGVQLAAPLNHFMALRVGYVFLPTLKHTFTADYTIPNVTQLNAIIDNPLYADVKNELQRQGLPTDVSQLPTATDIYGKLGLGNAKLLVDFYPSQHSSFHLTVGAFAGKSSLVSGSGTIPPSTLGVYDVLSTYAQQYGYDFPNQIEVGNQVFTAQELSYVEVNAKVNTVKPYAGFGFGRPVPRGRVGVQCDFGVAYMGKARLIGNTDKITSALNEELEKQGDSKYLSYTSFYPMISLQINVRLF